jgi:hypothetical protein
MINGNGPIAEFSIPVRVPVTIYFSIKLLISKKRVMLQKVPESHTYLASFYREKRIVHIIWPISSTVHSYLLLISINLFMIHQLSFTLVIKQLAIFAEWAVSVFVSNSRNQLGSVRTVHQISITNTVVIHL